MFRLRYLSGPVVWGAVTGGTKAPLYGAELPTISVSPTGAGAPKASLVQREVPPISGGGGIDAGQ